MIESDFFRRIIEAKKKIKMNQFRIKALREQQKKDYTCLKYFDYKIVKNIELNVDKYNSYIIADGIKYDKIKKMIIEESIVDDTSSCLLSIYIVYGDENLEDKQLFFATNSEALGAFEEYDIKIKSDKGEDLIEEETVDESAE